MNIAVFAILAVAFFATMAAFYFYDRLMLARAERDDANTRLKHWEERNIELRNEANDAKAALRYALGQEEWVGTWHRPLLSAPQRGGRA